MSERKAKDTVDFSVEGGVAWVKFNRPEKRNAQSPSLNRRMLEVLDELEFRDDVGVLVLSGEGAAWTAGMDLKEYFRESAANGLAGVRKSQREAFTWWRRLRWYQKPTIAMVNGWCFGGAYGPLFACDLAFCADDAQFGLSEINWGILPGGGATKVVTSLMGFRDAMYHEVGERLLKKNPVALKATKDSVRRVVEMTYENAEDYLIRAQEAADSFDPEGRTEGMKQFLDDKSYKPGLGAYDLSKQKPKKRA
ncbi:MAG: enoyl-CoA hydratase/carnithine racemase [Alphaproteobacteria bacterium]|nr:MAG: enoyl-CoA hydratase/carnithine racemase [Alphaproteobacteria bacterium]